MSSGLFIRAIRLPKYETALSEPDVRFEAHYGLNSDIALSQLRNLACLPGSPLLSNILTFILSLRSICGGLFCHSLGFDGSSAPYGNACVERDRPFPHVSSKALNDAILDASIFH